MRRPPWRAGPTRCNCRPSPRRSRIDHWDIDWDDGQHQEVSGDPSSVDHVYADGDATYRITADATDEEENEYSVGDPGRPNAVFGGDGWVTTIFRPGADYEYAVAQQTDGKLVVAGTGDDRAFRVTRYNTDGTLDQDFGTGGTVATCVGMWSEARAVAISDGKVVVVGEVYKDTKYDFGVARYNADGTPDATFSGDGKLTSDFGYLGNSDSAYAVAIQTVGVPEVEKILVAGNAYNGYNYDFIVVRYNPDGALDTTFGTGGKVLTDFAGGNDYAYGIAVDDASGWIIVVGQAYNGSAWDSAMLRLDPDGELDTTFGGTQDGKVYTNMGGTDYALSVALQSDGKIVVAGAACPASNFDFALARYNSDGTLDTTFDNDGKVVTNFVGGNDYAYDVALQPDGKIVVVGNAWNVNNNEFAVARYNTDGSLDTTFTDDGKVLTDFESGNDYAYGVVIEPDGRIVAAGRAYNGTNDDFALACYNPDGSLYTQFGTSGTVLTDFASSTDPGSPGGWDGAQAIALVPREDITGLDSLDLIVAGQVWTDQYDFAAVRYFSPSGGLPVQVPNVAPTLTVPYPQTVLVGQSFTITDLGTFTDPGFDNPYSDPETYETFAYTIDWGDESQPDSGTATIDTPGSAGQPTEGSFDGTHTYSETGDYTVTITLSDDDNGEDIQYLDITSAPDVSATGFSADGTSLLVDYHVFGAALPSLAIGIYLSSDGTTPESLLQTLNVTNSTDLSVGAHEVCITPDLPEIQDDYYLIAVVDADGTITEPDEDNNDFLFEGGVFLSGETVYVHGSVSADNIAANLATRDNQTWLDITFEGTHSYHAEDVSAIYVFGHDGDDAISVNSAITLPVSIFGGPGDDEITGGGGADYIDGGLGVDTIHGGPGDDYIDGGDGDDYLYFYSIALVLEVFGF